MIYVGTKLYGYCGGCFGDSYGDKTVEGVGADWIAARDENTNTVVMANFINTEDMERLVKEWL